MPWIKSRSARSAGQKNQTKTLTLDTEDKENVPCQLANSNKPIVCHKKKYENTQRQVRHLKKRGKTLRESITEMKIAAAESSSEKSRMMASKLKSKQHETMMKEQLGWEIVEHQQADVLSTQRNTTL